MKYDPEIMKQASFKFGRIDRVLCMQLVGNQRGSLMMARVARDGGKAIGVAALQKEHKGINDHCQQVWLP